MFIGYCGKSEGAKRGKKFLSGKKKKKTKNKNNDSISVPFFYKCRF